MVRHHKKLRGEESPKHGVRNEMFTVLVNHIVAQPRGWKIEITMNLGDGTLKNYFGFPNE